MRRLAWTCGGFSGAIFLAHYLLPGKGLLVFALLAAALSVGFGLTGKETLRRAVLCCFGAAPLSIGLMMAYHCILNKYRKK